MAADTPDVDDEAELSYEQARDELVDVVRRLEAGGTTLEESLALWQRGEKLAQVCQRWLDGARTKLDAAANMAENACVFHARRDRRRRQARGGWATTPAPNHPLHCLTTRKFGASRVDALTPHDRGHQEFWRVTSG